MAEVPLAVVDVAAYYQQMVVYLMILLPADDRDGDFDAGRTVFLAVGSAGPAYVGVVAD